MTTREEHKRTVRKYPKAVASGDLGVIDEICTEDVVEGDRVATRLTNGCDRHDDERRRPSRLNLRRRIGL